MDADRVILLVLCALLVIATFCLVLEFRQQRLTLSNLLAYVSLVVTAYNHGWTHFMPPNVSVAALCASTSAGDRSRWQLVFHNRGSTGTRVVSLRVTPKGRKAFVRPQSFSDVVVRSRDQTPVDFRLENEEGRSLALHDFPAAVGVQFAYLRGAKEVRREVIVKLDLPRSSP